MPLCVSPAHAVWPARRSKRQDLLNRTMVGDDWRGSSIRRSICRHAPSELSIQWRSALVIVQAAADALDGANKAAKAIRIKARSINFILSPDTI